MDIPLVGVNLLHVATHIILDNVNTSVYSDALMQ
jgi:hypothetical protein